MELILLAVFVIWAVGCFALPITVWRDSVGGGNAKARPGFIRMRRGLDYPGAVWAQEWYEARRRWLCLPLDMPLMLIGRAVPRMAFYERWFEIMGHAIEIEAEAMLRDTTARGTDFPRIIQREAQALAKYRAFEGWLTKEIDGELRAELRRARQWVRRKDRARRIFKMNRKGKR